MKLCIPDLLEAQQIAEAGLVVEASGCCGPLVIGLVLDWVLQPAGRFDYWHFASGLAFCERPSHAYSALQ